MTYPPSPFPRKGVTRAGDTPDNFSTPPWGGPAEGL
jgi:hypothetical protein